MVYENQLLISMLLSPKNALELVINQEEEEEEEKE